jgi:hypothetical protein
MWFRFRHEPLFQLWLAAAALGAICAVDCRFAMNPDGMSYLGISDSILQHDWRNVVNGHWSPLYPLLLAAFLGILRPSPAWESTVVHVLNYGIYLGALAMFTGFLKRFTDDMASAAARSDGGTSAPRTAWYAFGYSVFAVSTLRLIPYGFVTPDLCVVLLFVKCADLTLAIQRKPDAPRPRVLLGIALGLSYLAKAAMFHMALLLLVLLPIKLGRKAPRGIAMHTITVLVFAALAGPWILALSRTYGHPTYSESGRLTYAWFVAQDADVTWSGPIPQGLAHPPKILFERPTVLGYDGPIPGAYPLWRDPAYWLSGMNPKFHVIQDLSVLLKNLLGEYYFPYLRDYGGLVAGLLCGLWVSRKSAPDGLRKAASRVSVPVVWACAGFVSYALVYVEQRYLAGFFLVLVVCAYSAVWLPDRGGGPPASHRVSSVALAIVALSMTLPLVSSAPLTAAWFASDVLHGRYFASDDDLHAAETLAGMGLRPGDKLASIGAAFNESFLRVGRFRNVAEAPDDQVNLFWQLDGERRAQLFKRLSAAGIKAIVAGGNSPRAELDTWTKLGSSNYYARLLSTP